MGDTMHVQPGVVLECMNKTKPGRDVANPEDKRMSRREYIQLTKAENERKRRPSSSTANGRNSKIAASLAVRPSSAPQNNVAESHMSSEQSAKDASCLLDVDKDLGRSSRKAPPAPAWSLRATKKAEASQ